MNNGKLTFLSGIPRSGKSTFCRKWIKEISERPRVIISGDAFRTALHSKEFIAEAESFVFAAMDVAARALLATGHDVIIDETATTENTILRYLRIDIDAECIYLPVELDLAIERAIDCNKNYLEKPIIRMYNQLQKLRENWPATLQRLKDEVLARKVVDICV